MARKSCPASHLGREFQKHAYVSIDDPRSTTTVSTADNPCAGSRKDAYDYAEGFSLNCSRKDGGNISVYGAGENTVRVDRGRMKCNDAEGSRKVSQSMANTNQWKDCGRISIRTDCAHALECKKHKNKIYSSRGRMAEALLPG